MFSDTSQSIQFGHEFVLQQRTRDIATKGFSTIAIPKPPKKAPAAKKIESCIEQIQDAIFNQEDYLSGISIRIHHTTRLMERLYGRDDKMAIATMTKIKSLQHEYVHILRVIAAMKAYEKHVKLGLMSPKNTEKNLKEIENVPWNQKPSKNVGKDALELMITEKRYFPVMSRGGKIEFSPTPAAVNSVSGAGSDCGGGISETFSSTSTRSTAESSSSRSSHSTRKSIS